MIGSQQSQRRKLQEELLNKEDEEQYIFFNEKKLVEKVEIEVIVSPDRKVIIIIDKDSTIEYLCIKIAEQMESLNEYSHLKGLKAVNLRRKSDPKGLVSIPSSGEIRDYISDGDIVYCDLQADECWVKIQLNVLNCFCNFDLKFDLKVKFSLNFNKLKLILLKMALNYFKLALQGVLSEEDKRGVKSNNKSSMLDNEKLAKIAKHHFIISGIDMKFNNTKANVPSSLTEDIFIGSISELKMSLTSSNSDFVTITAPTTDLSHYIDFNSEIKLKINIDSLEEILFKELQNNLKIENEIERYKVEELKSIPNFSFFIGNINFEKELKTMIKLINSYIFTSKNEIYNFSTKDIDIITTFTNRSFSSNDTDKLEKEKVTKIFIFSIENKKGNSQKRKSQNLLLRNHGSKFYESSIDRYVENKKERDKNLQKATSANNIIKLMTPEQRNNLNLSKSIIGNNSMNSMNNSQDSVNPQTKKSFIEETEENLESSRRLEGGRKNPQIVRCKTFIEPTKSKFEKSETLPSTVSKFLKLTRNPTKYMDLSQNIKNQFSLDRFMEILKEYNKLQIFPFSLEKTKIPDYRNVQFQEKKNKNNNNSVIEREKISRINFKLFGIIIAIILIIVAIFSLVLYIYNK